MPVFQTGDVTTLLLGLSTAMQGILDFFVSGATLWFTLAGALIILAVFRRILGLRRA